MPRGTKKIPKRIPPPDAKYGSVTVAKFINRLMLRGQKATAERVIYSALQIAADQVNSKPEEALEKAIKSVAPLLMVKSRRVGGATYQVPTEVGEEQGRALAIKWLITSARARSGKSMKEKLASEFVDAVNGRGAAIKKRDDIHKMAEANKAFAHYRW
ncbi:MAG TPA: 30S ribosomal protein S7 [Dehalococcoidia bacterium]|jgi:small subunit ribosomal protein S7|nr:30S ribosomal protein S7 [Dehalococcoidia bacterium]